MTTGSPGWPALSHPGLTQFEACVEDRHDNEGKHQEAPDRERSPGNWSKAAARESGMDDCSVGLVTNE